MQQPPEKIDKYQILSVIGKGAMGVVYHAYDPVVKRDVAIKLLSAIGSEETELISRFEREARLAGSLRHPNIVTIYDLGHFEGRPYIVMEHIVGRDLQAVIKQKQELTFEQKVEIVLQICKGLDAAHQKGIIHRDIKPANIRLQEDNTLKIMDFGIARMGTSELTRSGYIIGTLQYMSPEQISGDQLDPRTDIFSTGVIAYELFTYNNPFNGEHTVDIMYRILNVRPQPIQDLPEEYGTELNTVILRALEKNRDLRYPNAKEMSQDLEEYLFYLKSLKFRRRAAAKVIPYSEGATQTIPVDQLPRPPARDAEVPPTMQADIGSMPTYHMPSPTFGIPEPQREEEKKEKVQKVPRTGVGANYSETAQVLMTHPSGWQERKFYILGAVLALLFISGLIFFSTVGQPEKTLALISNPVGAEIWINGQNFGRTPATIKQKEKSLDLMFRMNGYQEKQVSVEKDQWPTEVNVTLDPVVKPVEITKPPIKPVEKPTSRVIQLVTNPPGATALLDGKEEGKTPANLTLPDDKPHVLALKLEGYEPLEHTIDPGTPETLSLDLKPVPVAVTGTIQYTGPYPVSIFKEGKLIKGNPVELEPGVYKLTFRTSRNAYIRFTKTVEVKAGEATIVQGPGMGKLTIKAIPSNCKIFLNGEYLDVAPVFNRPIQAGAHRVQFNWETLGKTQTQTVEITAGQNQTITGIAE